MRQAAERGARADQDAAIKEATTARLRDLRRAKVYAAYQEAACDQRFMVDMEEAAAAFDAALLDGISEP